MEVQLSYNGEVPSPPPLTPLPVMALVAESQRGALALLACIQPLVTSQITVHLLKFAIFGQRYFDLRQMS